MGRLLAIRTPALPCLFAWHPVSSNATLVARFERALAWSFAACVDDVRGFSMQVGVQSFASRARPVFETKEAERVHSLQRLAATCRIFGRRGYSEGLLGHITVRDPELPDHFWVNPVGIPMHQVRVSDLVQVNHQGQVVHGNAMVNPVGLLLHTAVHRSRPEVVAVCHAHALHASTWASFERLLDPSSSRTRH